MMQWPLTTLLCVAVGEFTLPSQSDSSEEEEESDDDQDQDQDQRPIVGIASNLSQFGRGTQPPVLTQRSNEAAGALLGLFNQAAAEESTGTVNIIETEELVEAETSINQEASEALSQQQEEDIGIKLTDGEARVFVNYLLRNIPIYDIKTNDDDGTISVATTNPNPTAVDSNVDSSSMWAQVIMKDAFLGYLEKNLAKIWLARKYFRKIRPLSLYILRRAQKFPFYVTEKTKKIVPTTDASS